MIFLLIFNVSNMSNIFGLNTFDFLDSHDFVRDVLFDIFRRIEISVKKEAPVNFSTDH